MIFDLLQKHARHIESYDVLNFHQIEHSYALVIEFHFTDGSKLTARDYLFLDGKRKYAFHYQQNDGQLIFRYDNAPHWPHLENSPYHKHLPDKIEPSEVMNLEKVLHEISERIKNAS